MDKFNYNFICIFDFYRFLIQLMHYMELNDINLLLLGCYFSETKDPVPSSDQTV